MGSRGLPSGTITFLFTDIEGSTKILTELGTDRYHRLLEVHAGLLRRALADGGREVRVDGDAFFVVFPRADKAIAAAAAIQRALAATDFPAGVRVRVRMGMHTGEGIPASAEAAADYVGLDVHRAARVAAAANGGQVLVSEATRHVVDGSLPPDVALRDLGLHRLKDFAEPERLFQLVAEGLASDFPPLRGPEEVPIALPVQLTTFVGREREIAEGARILADARLLTLTGPGGTGKTRLALQVAAGVAADFRDGTFWVSLAAIRDPDLVMMEIAASLRLPEGPRPARARVADHLRHKVALLVLDNFEQVLAAGAAVTELLRAAPQVKAIVTSRAPLRVQGEREFPVPPLGMPPRDLPLAPEALAQHEATRLFLDRATAARRDLPMTSEDAQAIAEITRRLDGLPLAIELAAASVRLLTPRELLATLDHALTALGAGGPDLPDRQRTLRGAIAWSHELLDPGARKLFGRMSVFAGTPRLAEVEAICGPAAELGIEVIDAVTTLVDHNLVRRTERQGETRLFLLTTIREFAADRLAAAGEVQDLDRRHAMTYLAVAERHSPHLRGASQREHLDDLENDHEDLRSALNWSIEHDPATGMRLAFALWRFWHMRGHMEEVRRPLEQLVALDPGDPTIRLIGLEAAAGIAYWQGDLHTAMQWYEERLALAERVGDARSVANALYDLGSAVGVQGSDLTRAAHLVGRSLAAARALGDPEGIAKALVTLSTGAALAGDLATAHAYLDEAVAALRVSGDLFGLGYALQQLGLLEVVAGRASAASGPLGEALRIFDAAGDVSGVTILLSAHAFHAFAVGDLSRATTLVGAATVQHDASGAGVGLLRAPGPLKSQIDKLLEVASDPAFAGARESGRRMDRSAAVAYALGSSSPADRSAASPVSGV